MIAMADQLAGHAALSHFRDADVGEENEVHHQGIDDGGDGDDLVMEDEGAAGDGDSLCGVLHADLDDEGASFPDSQFQEPCKQCAATGCRQNQHRHREAQGRELCDDGLLVLDEEDRYQQQQSRHGDAFEYVVNLLCDLRAEHIDEETDGDRYNHEHEVLHQQVAYGQVNIRRLSYARCHPCHDQRQGEEGDDTAAGCECDRERHVAFRQHREHIARAASRAAGDEHYSYDE